VIACPGAWKSSRDGIDPLLTMSSTDSFCDQQPRGLQVAQQQHLHVSERIDFT
jgi:hypothetical protein